MRIQETSAYVIMIDVVGFTERGGKEATKYVDDFLQVIQRNLSIIDGQKFNIFPTGDGAIICIYQQDHSIREMLAELPLKFSIAVLKSNKINPFDLRISINYSEVERIIDVTDFNSLDTNHIEVGMGINVAERVIHFCEPNEVIINKTYHDVLFDLNFTKEKYQFHGHKSVFVKHMRDLVIFSYLPKEVEMQYVYDLRKEGKQHFRKFAYFPPIKGATLRKIKILGLETDIHQICSYAYDTLATVNKDCIFISWGTVYDTLKKIPTEQEEEILVVSRDDLKKDFWSTKAAQSYLSNLERGERFNQYRIFIYDPYMDSSTPSEIYDRLARLHGKDTLRKIDKTYVEGNVLLKFIFGVTIFPNLKCAVAPMPVPVSYDEYVSNIQFTKVEDMFSRYREHDFSNTIFKALVIANEEMVDDLVKAFYSLRAHKRIEQISIR